jgi:hypothetical protein
MTGVRITKVERVGGHWRARVTAGGITHPVDRSCGSWLAPVGAPTAREAPRAREVLPVVARELQARVKRQERRERRARADA